MFKKNVLPFLESSRTIYTSNARIHMVQLYGIAYILLSENVLFSVYHRFCRLVGHYCSCSADHLIAGTSKLIVKEDFPMTGYVTQ